MTELAVLLGLAGVLLVMVGLLGGGFTFSGTIVPRVGRLIRLPCFLVGGIFVVLSVGLIIFLRTDAAAGPSTKVLPPSPSDRSEPPPVTTTRVPPAVRARTGTVAGDHGAAEIYRDASPDRPMGSVTNGAEIQIICTTEGVVVRSDAGSVSSLWNFVTDGDWRGYIPDVYLYTGTDQPTMPSCNAI